MSRMSDERVQPYGVSQTGNVSMGAGAFTYCLWLFFHRSSSAPEGWGEKHSWRMSQRLPGLSQRRWTWTNLSERWNSKWEPDFSVQPLERKISCSADNERVADFFGAIRCGLKGWNENNPASSCWERTNIMRRPFILPVMRDMIILLHKASKRAEFCFRYPVIINLSRFCLQRWFGSSEGNLQLS